MASIKDILSNIKESSEIHTSNSYEDISKTLPQLEINPKDFEKTWWEYVKDNIWNILNTGLAAVALIIAIISSK